MSLAAMRTSARAFCLLAAATMTSVGNAQVDPSKIDQGIAPNFDDREIPELKIAVGLQSADGLIDDLRWIVSDLAGKEETFDQKIIENIEIFLFGVDRTLPARFDIIFGSDTEYRLNLMVPISDTKDFRLDNVEPIGIDMRRKSSDFYELLGDVYEGWLKFLEGEDAIYGVFGTKETPDDVEITLEDILARNKQLKLDDYDASILIDADSGPSEGRDALIAKMREQALSTLSRRPDETQEAFEFRKLLTQQRYERIATVLSGAQRIAAGLKNDKSENGGRLDFEVVPSVDTKLAEVIEAIGAEPSRFAGVPTIEDPIVTARLSVAMHDSRRQRLADLLKAAQPVTKNRVDENDSSKAEKEAQHNLVDLVYKQLTDGLDQKLISGFYEVREVDSGNQFALGVTTLNGSQIGDILAVLPDAIPTAEVTADAETAANMSLTKVSLPEMSAALKDHLGGIVDFFVGYTDDALYVCGGPDSTALLAECLDELEPEATDVALSLRMHASPMAELIDTVMTNRDFSLIEFMQDRREERLDANDREARTMNVGDPKEWRQAAIKAMAAKGLSGDDVLAINIRRDDESLVGEATLGTALLAALGELIAKFADENL